jgi:hypothetical protein
MVVRTCPMAIERVFRKWRDIPSKWDFWEETWGLEHATKELTLSPDEDSEGSLELGNTRLAAELSRARGTLLSTASLPPPTSRP